MLPAGFFTVADTDSGDLDTHDVPIVLLLLIVSIEATVGFTKFASVPIMLAVLWQEF